MKYHIDSVILAEQSLLGALMQEPEKLVEVKAAVDVEGNTARKAPISTTLRKALKTTNAIKVSE